MVPPNKTVVLGEASESDGDDISLDEENQSFDIDLRTSQESTDDHQFKTSQKQQDSRVERRFRPNKSSERALSGLGSSLFATIESSSSKLAKLVNYSSQSLLSQTRSPQWHSDATSKLDKKAHFPPLHKTLYLKNQQLYASLAHLYRHPHEKASKTMHSISQKMVNVQKSIQEIDVAVMKIQKEQKNFDVKIDSIVRITG